MPPSITVAITTVNLTADTSAWYDGTGYGVTNDGATTISGTTNSATLANVEILANNGTTTVDWGSANITGTDFELDLSSLPDASYSLITATATDIAANTGTITFTGTVTSQVPETSNPTPSGFTVYSVVPASSSVVVAPSGTTVTVTGHVSGPAAYLKNVNLPDAPNGSVLLQAYASADVSKVYPQTAFAIVNGSGNFTGDLTLPYLSAFGPSATEYTQVEVVLEDLASNNNYPDGTAYAISPPVYSLGFDSDAAFFLTP